MESPDVVDTSDVDERDVLALPIDVVLRTASASTTHLAPPQNDQCQPTLITRHDQFSDHEIEDASPRKRIKIAHSRGSVSPGSTYSMVTETSLSGNKFLKMIPMPQSLPPEQSQESMPMCEDEEQTSVLFSPPKDFHPTFSNRPGYSNPDTTNRVWSQDMESRLTSQPLPRSLSRSLSISTDHHSLFSSPLCRTAAPPQTSSQHSSDQPPFAGRDPNSVHSSPLTPTSSPPLLPRTPSQSPDPIKLTSPRSSHTLVSRPAPVSTTSNYGPSVPVEIPEDPQPLGRYSLRRRQARQLNPYAYDKLLYKQQLKYHPDAIVKFRSPQRRNESAGVRADGTQDELVFPLDNPEEDSEYLGGGNKRKIKVPSFHRSNESGEDVQGPLGEGWLPEFLKELSNSDEDDNEFRRLARRIRKEREWDAKARRTIAEPPKVEVDSRKSAKMKLQPFPIRGVAFSPLPVPSAVQLPASSPRSSLLPSTLPRSARSPSSDSGPLQSPDFSAYLQQEGSYQCNEYDNEARFLRDHSPVDHSVTYSVPPSPSVPTITSGASPLPSYASGIGSESDRSSAFEMNSKDRKRLRALKRMMPAAMIARQLGNNNTKPPTSSRVRVATESSGSEVEEVRLVPGIARVRKGRHKDVEVRGDPESSDVELTEVYSDEKREDASPGMMVVSSDGPVPFRVRRMRHNSLGNEDVISLSDSSMPGSSSEDSGCSSSDGEEAHQSLLDRPARAPAREKSLIDWMLSRTKGSGGSKHKYKQPMGRRKPRGTKAPRLDVVTSGARRYDEYHQTLLHFVRAGASTNTTSSTTHDLGHRDRIVRLDQDTVEERKGRKNKRNRQSRTHQGPIYNIIHHDATRITSKHREDKDGRGRATLVIKDNDNEFRQALDPGWRAEIERWNKSDSARKPVTNLTTSSPAAPRSHLYRRISPQPQREIPLPFYFQREEASGHRHIVVDMNITPLPSGVKFGTSSYIGKGLLYQLISVISGSSEVTRPMFCNVQGLEIGPTTSAAVFSALLGPLCDRLVSALREFRPDNTNTTKEWESVIRSSTQLLSWLAVHAEDQEFNALELALREHSDGLLLVLDSLETNVFTLAAHWFIVELAARLVTGVKYRQGSAENHHLIQSTKQLIQHLLGVNLQPAFATFRTAKGDVDDTSLPHRAAELWICLMHMLPSIEISTEVVSGHPLWHLLVNLLPESSPTGAEASEDMWRTIFSLCSISQFSVHGLSTSIFRLPAAWGLVATALKKIVLTADPEKECQLPQRALRKRDDYVRYVVSRCFLLWNQWGWRLDDGIIMFKSLQEIFRSRNFANLLNEHSVPMGFLENGDLELLSKRDPNDSVFEVFLKMVVQAVNMLNANVDLDPKQRLVNVKKLLQMAVPVSPVPFSRSAPPSVQSLSMLVNRFSAMAIAIHLDPTASNVKFRIGQARRCVDFQDADDNSRVACIYGMMNFAMIVRHHKIHGGLEDVLGWLKEMTDVLMDEYKEDETGVRKKTITTLIQLLIGSVRRVIETQSLDREQNQREYPDPALLDGPWVTRVFNPRTELVTMQQTGVEIRMLVKSFLSARLKALPDVQPPPVVHSAESQDEYDRAFLDLADEELLAALGEETEASAVADLKLKEDALCKVLDKSITPAVYRLVCKHLGESEHVKNSSAKAADEWIDCWVGCANVLVQNNYKDWGLYMKLGQQSWEKIINDSWRRRVGLRFNLTLLRLDPGAYSKMKDDFIAVLLVAILSSKTTIEHEFVSVVLSLDGLQHQLLRGAPFKPIPETRKYECSQADYEAVRVQLIETVFWNITRCLREWVNAESQGYVELVVVVLSTMRDIYQELNEKAEYGKFCRRVFDTLSGHPELASHPRVSGALAWWDHVIV